MDKRPKRNPKPKKFHDEVYDLDKDEKGEEEDYVVEDLCDSRIRNGKKEYLIKWEGFPRSKNTWEPTSNVDPKSIAEYENSVKGKKRGSSQPEKGNAAKRKKISDDQKDPEVEDESETSQQKTQKATSTANYPSYKNPVTEMDEKKLFPALLRSTFLEACRGPIRFTKHVKIKGTIEIEVDDKEVTISLNDLIIHGQSSDGKRDVCLLTEVLKKGKSTTKGKFVEACIIEDETESGRSTRVQTLDSAGAKESGVVVCLPSLTQGFTTFPEPFAGFAEKSQFEIVYPYVMTSSGNQTTGGGLYAKKKYYLPERDTASVEYTPSEVVSDEESENESTEPKESSKGKEIKKEDGEYAIDNILESIEDLMDIEGVTETKPKIAKIKRKLHVKDEYCKAELDIPELYQQPYYIPGIDDYVEDREERLMVLQEMEMIKREYEEEDPDNSEDGDSDGDDEIFSCSVCRKTYLDKTMFEQHKEYAHPCTLCHMCGKLDQTVLQNHMAKCKTSFEAFRKGQNYTCEKCGKTWLKKWDLNRHICARKNVFMCLVCRVDFVYQDRLSYHEAIAHGHEKGTCPICKLHVPRDQYMKHYFTHNNAIKFICDECNGSFPTQKAFNEHMQTHMDNPMHCPLCYSNFTTVETRDNHIKFCDAQLKRYSRVPKKENIMPSPSKKTVVVTVAGETSEQQELAVQNQQPVVIQEVGGKWDVNAHEIGGTTMLVQNVKPEEQEQYYQVEERQEVVDEEQQQAPTEIILPASVMENIPIGQVIEIPTEMYANGTSIEEILLHFASQIGTKQS